MHEKIAESQITEHLLTETRQVILQQKKDEAKQGIGFNIFQILKRNHDEVNGHSAFIATLLDSRGAHAQGAKFLSLFVEKLETAIKSDNELLKKTIDTTPLTSPSNLWKVTPEKYFPNKNPGSTSKGNFIDILITTPDYAIVIENKINAKDQPNQLWRYKQSVTKEYGDKKKIILIYLTKSGYQPSESSLKKESSIEGGDNVSIDEVLCLSYKEFIQEWIEECIGAVPLIPHIRETLFQYNITLQQITGKGGMMSNAIKEVIIGNTQFFHASRAMAVAHAFTNAKIELQEFFWDHLKQKLKDLIDELNVNEKEFSHNEVFELFQDYSTIKIKDFYKAKKSTGFYYGVGIWIKDETMCKFNLHDHARLQVGIRKYNNKVEIKEVDLSERDRIENKLSYLLPQVSVLKSWEHNNNGRVTIEIDKWTGFFHNFGVELQDQKKGMEEHIVTWIDQCLKDLNIKKVLSDIATVIDEG